MKSYFPDNLKVSKWEGKGAVTMHFLPGTGQYKTIRHSLGPPDILANLSEQTWLEKLGWLRNELVPLSYPTRGKDKNRGCLCTCKSQFYPRHASPAVQLYVVPYSGRVPEPLILCSIPL